jgi:hypothetical protein
MHKSKTIQQYSYQDKLSVMSEQLQVSFSTGYYGKENFLVPCVNIVICDCIHC